MMKKEKEKSINQPKKLIFTVDTPTDYEGKENTEIQEAIKIVLPEK